MGTIPARRSLNCEVRSGGLAREAAVVATPSAGVSVDNDTGPSLIHEALFSARLCVSSQER